MRCTDIAAVKAIEVTELIQRALDDTAARLSGMVGMVTSTDDVPVSAAASVHVSQTETVNMTDAKRTAVTVLSATVSDDDDDVSSTSSLDSVPSAAVIDSGIYYSSLLCLSLDDLASEVFSKFAI